MSTKGSLEAIIEIAKKKLEPLKVQKIMKQNTANGQE